MAGHQVRPGRGDQGAKLLDKRKRIEQDGPGSGNADSNPGTLTFQSEVFFEAVRGAGGTARRVLLPFEDHGYRARESIEHVLWEQIKWLDMYVKNVE